MVCFDRPDKGNHKAKTPQYQAPRDLIDDDIDSSVELTEVSPSDKVSAHSQAALGKRKRDSKLEEEKSVDRMAKTKKRKVTNNN